MFTQSLLSDLPILAPTVSPSAAIRAGTGAEAVRGLLPPLSPELGGLLLAYSYAFDKTFYVVAAFGLVSMAFACFMGWGGGAGRRKRTGAYDEDHVAKKKPTEV